MRFIAAFCLSFLASALAYSVITPSTSQGWTNDGAQPCTWQRVDSDRLNFTALLVNPDFSVKQILSALVDGSLSQISLNPPSTGWPTGKNFRLNFVQDTEHLDTILAQSGPFSILPPNNTVSSTTTLPTTAYVPTTNAATTPSLTSTSNTNPPSNAASPSTRIQSGLLSIFAFMGFLLA